MDQAAKLDSLWKDYSLAKEFGPRAKALGLLDMVIAQLLAFSDEERRVWVERLLSCPKFTDMHFPLFDKVLLPILSQGVLEGRPNYARWLGGLSVSGWYRAVERSEILPESLKTPRALFQLALVHDLGDSVARCQLIKSDLEGIRYSLHELPSGVLYSGGASAEECEIMLEDLEKLETLLEIEGLTEKYQTVVEYARFHYQAYWDYLLNHSGRGFSGLLADGIWGTPPEPPHPSSWS